MSMSEGRCVALLGATRNTDNYGVRVLLTAAVAALRKVEPDASIVSLDYGRRPEAWCEATGADSTPVSLVNLRYSWRIWLPNNIVVQLLLALAWRALPSARWQAWLRRRNRTFDTILGVDRGYAICGGDSFSDVYGLGRLVYVALPMILLLVLGRSLTLLPQTYGPFRLAPSRWIARWVIARADTVMSRDAAGVETIAGLLGRAGGAAVIEAPDLGFSMPARPISTRLHARLEQLRLRGPVVGLNVSRLLYIGGYDRENMFGLRQPYPELVRDLTMSLTNELGAQVVLVPHVCGGPASEEDETALCAQLHDALAAAARGRLHRLDEALDHQQIKAAIRHFDIFVGARMHACIGAASQAVPTVCLAYSDKFAGVMKPLGPAVKVVDLRTASAGACVDAVRELMLDRANRRRELEAAVANLADRHGRLVGAMRELVRSASGEGGTAGPSVRTPGDRSAAGSR